MNSTTSDIQTNYAISVKSESACYKNPIVLVRKSNIILLRKNQKGQVAIFVALIFQVVFVFFALMINVGLLIHQKINLQHSTDLAAYYGAMKQAEQLNAIAHINFQMRQAWKLMTWRYRVLGTFGYIKGSGVSQDYPFENVAGNTWKYNGAVGRHPSIGSRYTNGFPTTPVSEPTMTCESAASGNPDYIVDGSPIGIQDIPFFCAAHAGFKSYPQSESYCQLTCDQYANAKTVALIPGLGSTYITPFGGNLANTVNSTISNVNQQINGKCAALGPLGAAMLARFLAAYSYEQYARNEAIKLLASNLSLDSETILDIEGQPIKDGSKRTFENNLTGANFTGLESDSFQVYNGYGFGDCRFRNGDPDDGRQFLKRIEFKLISYFVLNCNPTGAYTSQQPQGVYQDTGSGLGSAFDTIDPALRNVVASFLNPQGLHKIGYEKNPHCIDYYAVKTNSSPNIPFLPLSKIKLQAVAVAKPFGGSIGPWYGTAWDVADPKSRYNDTDPETKMDPTLPMRDFTGEPNARLLRSVYSQPNFSLFVGDHLGLRNLDYLAAFHSALAIRDINSYPGTNSANAINNGMKLANTMSWPDYPNWANLDDASAGDLRSWDSLATEAPDGSGVSQGGVRALEIAAIAPNQFDIYNYSIDPDFYNNYYVKLYKGFDNIKNATGGAAAISKNQLRPDFGARDVDDTGGVSPPMSFRTFSVKDQILVKNQVLDIRPKWYGVGSVPNPPAGAQGDTYNDFMNYLVSAQSSLLTAWTFLRFNDYRAFPSGTVNRTDNTMAFGQCDDVWNKTSNALASKTDPQGFETPMSVNSDYPGTTGNCVTGGRTGYSVKIISPRQVGGTDANNPMVNPIDPSFFQF